MKPRQNGKPSTTSNFHTSWTRTHAVRPIAIIAVSIVLLGGCGTRPHAPALGEEPVYQNKAEGFRFLAPEGWVPYAKKEYPPGRAEKEHLLVAYKRMNAEKPAALEVSLVDLPLSTDLEKYFAGSSLGARFWLLQGDVEELEVDGLRGLRLTYTATLDKEPTTKEVSAFWRGERLYFFTGIFSTSDAKAREEVRRCVSSVLWKQ
jgi:hypothetical protein